MRNEELETLRAMKLLTRSDVLFLERHLPRLLEERERLMEALGEIAGNDGSMSSHEMIFAAEDALAFAEQDGRDSGTASVSEPPEGRPK